AVTYGEPPHRFEAGTPPIVQAIGFGAASRETSRIISPPPLKGGMTARCSYLP
ncbi:aminotransferase class V-fold PLP-dependent enzyme, partial [Streptomyces sp. P17]|uniref:aminotransferase class V-fold PLP-dependent enzyme n=1 Tax=Streptomyces sp. P17 TaxID=3074716 RepID=UPI0037DDA8F0